MDELIAALGALGAFVDAPERAGLPLRVGGSPVTGGSVVLSGARSSQFASALLLGAPAFQRGLRLEVAPPRVSFPYVKLTVEILRAFAATVDTPGEATFRVPPQKLRATEIDIDGDFSAGSYLFAAAAILGGRVRVRGLRAGSSQPDERFLQDLARLGCRIAWEGRGVVVEGPARIPAFAWDLRDAPDLAPTAAILALFADGPSALSGLAHLTLKESDRLSVLRENLVRLGAEASAAGDTLSIVPPSPRDRHGGEIRVAGDHRIAMAFAIAGLAIPEVTIDDPGVVGKSYPGFWDDLAALARTGS
jgi:3-phosphoshikimate 1-carboxyvinyltransferase